MDKKFKIKDSSKIHEVIDGAILEGNISDIVIGDDDTVVYTTILASSTKRSANGLLFSIEDFESILADPKIVDALERKALYCEFGHPNIKSNPRALYEINPAMVSSRLNRMWIQDGQLYGEKETVTFAKGKDLRDAILKDGLIPGTSMRASRNKRTGKLSLTTFDDVILPSAGSAVGDMTNVTIKSRGKIVKENINLLESVDQNGFLDNNCDVRLFHDAYILEDNGMTITGAIQSGDTTYIVEDGGLSTYKDKKTSLNKYILESLKDKVK